MIIVYIWSLYSPLFRLYHCYYRTSCLFCLPNGTNRPTIDLRQRTTCMHRMHFHACCGRLMYLKICTSRFNEIPQYLKYLAVRYNKHCRRHPAGWTVHHVQDPGLLHGRLVQYTIGLSGFYHCVIIWTYSTVITLPMTPNCDHHAVITLPTTPHLTPVLLWPCANSAGPWGVMLSGHSVGWQWTL